MISAREFARFASDPAAFRDALTVDVDGVPRRLGGVLDDWQREDFAALDPALRRCAGRSDADALMRAYLERPRGHSKTTDLAVTVCWALAFATRPLRGYAFAADRDQAALLKDAIAVLTRLNPWLGEILEVQKDSVVVVAPGHPGAGGTLTISTSDVGSSYGILPDLIVADELTHWSGDGGLWNSLISSAGKRSSCLLVVISNAGFADSWAWNVREVARTDPAWIFSRLDGPGASWMTPARLDEQRRMLPPAAYARLWLNRWSSAGGDALSPEDIDAAFREDLAPLTRANPGLEMVAGVDLATTRDNAAVCVLGVRRGRRRHGAIRLAATKLWRPTKERRIDLQEVEDWLRQAHGRFDFADVRYDPWQAVHLASRLQSGGAFGIARASSYRPAVPMVEVPPTGQNLQRIATATLEAFADRRLELYEEPDLRRDIQRLRVEERSYGFRLVSPRDGTGHGDMASAFGLALLAASELAAKHQTLITSIDGLIEAAEGEPGEDPMAARMSWLREFADGGGRIL